MGKIMQSLAIKKQAGRVGIKKRSESILHPFHKIILASYITTKRDKFAKRCAVNGKYLQMFV